jgi:hypothetical protein
MILYYATADKYFCVRKAFKIFMLNVCYSQSDRIFISIKIFLCGDALPVLRYAAGLSFRGF